MARERAIANQLAKLLGASNLPIYAVDDRRRIVYCNEVCAGWLGVKVEELVGLRCDYHSADDSRSLENLAARLCPPPDALLGDPPLSRFQIVGGTSGTSPRSAVCICLPGSDGESAGVVVFVQEPDGEDVWNATESSDTAAAKQLHLRLQQIVLEQRMPYRLERLVGESLAMQLVRQQVKVAVETAANVQIVGPVGCGREFLGRTIHAGEFPEQSGPLMPLDCNLLDGELLQATVVAFLHRAVEADSAHPATLLLLDADKLNAEAQTELLGFFRVPTFALRTIATTRQPLLSLTNDGTFLRELAYRLGTLTIELPALEQRREDLPLLCQRFLEDFNSRGEKQLSGFAAGVLDHLCALPWTGDVAELAAVVRETCEQADGPLITESDLARHVKHVTSAIINPPPEPETIMLDEFLVDVERELLQRALQTAKGNKAEAARLLGISRARVIRRAAALGLE